MGILHGAARTGDLAAVKAELLRGTNPNIPEKRGGLALVSAAGNGHLKIVQALLGAGAKIDEVSDEDGHYTPLMAAARSGHTEIVRLLLQWGAEVNAGASTGEATALMYAVSSGSVPTIRLLLESGADPKARAEGCNQSVWEWAKEEEDLHDNAEAILHILQQAGADG